eukprot:scaffold39307_cov69-Phaeocystis_antarctica.AAC.1
MAEDLAGRLRTTTRVPCEDGCAPTKPEEGFSSIAPILSSSSLMVCMNPSFCLIAPEATSSTIFAEPETGVLNHCWIDEMERPIDEAAAMREATIGPTDWTRPSNANEKS